MKIVDLFCGVGGFRKGFDVAAREEGTTVKTVASADNDRWVARTYEHLYGENPHGDVSSEHFKEYLTSLGSYDVLCAGFPCQPFSRSGAQEGFANTTKGTLFFDLADILNRTNPPAFLFENVDNLTSHDKGKTFSTIINTVVSELNYHVVGVKSTPSGLTFPRANFVVNSKHFGVPQNRPRVYLMGFSKEHYPQDVLDSFAPKNLPTSRSLPPIYDDLNGVLENAVEAKYYIARDALQSMKNHRARHEGKGNGFGYVVVNETPHPIANALLATGGSGKERNIVCDPNGAQFAHVVVEGKQSPLNNENLRYMTPVEWGKLQGFINYAFLNEKGEDLFSFPESVSNTQRYKMFGNAVTVPVVEEMAKTLMRFFTATV